MGADGLVGDRHGEWILTERAFLHVIDKLMALGKPLLLLGGGKAMIVFLSN
jgi:acetoin utilization deacetylase AcuC-like enzyme